MVTKTSSKIPRWVMFFGWILFISHVAGMIIWEPTLTTAIFVVDISLLIAFLFWLFWFNSYDSQGNPR